MSTKISITLSAYREMEQIPQSLLRPIGEGIKGLADELRPPGSAPLKGIDGCFYLAVDDYYILYHMADNSILTILGVLNGPYHPLH